MAQHRLPGRARPRDCRPRGEDRPRRERGSRRATLPRSAAWWIPAASAPVACAGLEQFCEKPATFTYNCQDKYLGGPTFGGYSESIVVDEAFYAEVSANANLAATAPLLCAGITTYSPLRHWKVGPGQKVGIVGLGGLGHMGVKLAHALGRARGAVHDVAGKSRGRAAAGRG